MAGDVSITVSQEIVAPILEAKIKAAIAHAMGGEEELLNKVLNTILFQKVTSDGKLSQYSSDNKYNWFDVIITKTIQEQVKEAVIEEVKLQSDVIKDFVKGQLKTAKGSSAVAEALVDAMNNSFANKWTSKFEINFKNKEV